MIDVLANSSFLALVAINMIAATGMNISYASGQLNLGQAGFLAVGAYTVAVVEVELGWPLLPLLAAGAAAAAVVAVPVAIGASRVRGIYLVMATVAVGEIVRIGIGNIDAVNGLQGYSGQSPVSLGGVIGALAVIVVCASLLMASRLGMQLRAVFDDEDAAAAAGVATRRVKILAVVTSAAIIGVAGGLLAKWLLFIAPSEFSVLRSFDIALYTLVGGVHSVAGGLVGALLATMVTELLRSLPRIGWVPEALHRLADWRLVVYGVLVMVLIALRPEGIISRRTGLWLATPFRRLRRRFATVGKEVAPPAPPPAGTTVLEVSDVGHRYGGLVALDGVSLEAKAGEVLGLIGANGAGKTTLIEVVAGRLTAERGVVKVMGRRIDALRPEQRTRAGVARTFQDPRSFAHLTVGETIRLGMWVGGKVTGSGVADILRLIGLVDRVDDLALSLPPGERRLLEMGRALAGRPHALLLDEPSVGMTDAERTEIAALVTDVRSRGVGVILVDHNLDLAVGLADRVAVLAFGTILTVAAPAAALADPRVRAAYLGTEDSAGDGGVSP